MVRSRPFRSLVIAMFVLVAAPLRADTIEARIASALSEQGYVIVSMERTWLGRLRVLAEDAAMRREMVFNPMTGEILRDMLIPLQMAEVLDGRPNRRASGPATGPANVIDSSPVIAATAEGGAPPVGDGDEDQVRAMTTTQTNLLFVIPEPLFPLVVE